MTSDSGTNPPPGGKRAVVPAFGRVTSPLVVCLNQDGCWRQTPEALGRFLGYAAEEITLREFGGLVMAEDRPAWGEASRRILGERADAVRTELRLTHANGDVIPIAVIATPEEPGGLRMFLHDLRSRAAMEEALEESEASLRFALMAAEFGVWDHDLRTDRISWKSYALDPRTIPLADSSTFFEFLEQLHPHDRSHVALQYLNCLEAGSPYAIEFRLMRADGEVCWMSARGRLLRDPEGNALRMVGVAANTTEREALRASLQEQQEFLDAILANLTEGILVFDTQGTLTYSNPAIRSVFALGVDPLSVGDWNARVPAFKPDTLQPLPVEERPVFRALRGERVQNAPIVYEIPGDGRRRMVVSAQAMLNREGERIGAVVALHDVTESHQLQQQLHQAQKLEAIGTLASGVAHDFNNMLGVMRGYTELSLLREDLDPALRGYLGEVLASADRAVALTRQLLAFSRREVVAPRQLDLREIITGTERMLRRLIGEDVRLSVEAAKEPLSVHADPGQLEQVLINLAVNARDAMPRGGQLTIEARAVELDETYTRRHAEVQPGHYALLAVTDTGVGMDSETLERIWEPFFTTKERGRGTGLGLWTVYGVVRRYNGHVWVYSEPGRGTTVKAYLPLMLTGETRSMTTEAPRLQHGTGTVLLVEDETMLRDLAHNVLKMSGYTVLAARDGQQALEISRSHPDRIDLLLTDVVMPGLSGREVAEQLLLERPDLRVLYMSGYTDDAIVRHGVLTSEVAFLEKPFTASALTAKVRELIRG